MVQSKFAGSWIFACLQIFLKSFVTHHTEFPFTRNDRAHEANACQKNCDDSLCIKLLRTVCSGRPCTCSVVRTISRSSTNKISHRQTCGSIAPLSKPSSRACAAVPPVHTSEHVFHALVSADATGFDVLTNRSFSRTSSASDLAPIFCMTWPR